MAENLNVSHYRNGDIIPQIQDPIEWSKQKGGAWCYFNNDNEIGKKLGKLYNWFAVADARGLSSKGWHIPSDEDWKKLTDFTGGEFVSGKKLKSKTGWNNNGNGTDEFGFSGLSSGIRGYDGKFLYQGEFAFWWSTTGGAQQIVQKIKHFIVRFPMQVTKLPD